MNFDDLKDQLLESLRTTWDRVQDSSIYNTIKERFDNLSSSGQKTAIAGGAALVLLLILMSPVEALFQSSEYVDEFNTKRELVRRMQSVSREAKQGPDISPPPPTGSLEGMVRRQLTSAKLLPEQILSVTSKPASGNLIPKELAETAIVVQLGKLNLIQVVDIGKRLEALHESAKLKDLLVAAGQNEDGYFDVTYEIVPLAVPRPASVEPDEDSSRSPRGRRPPIPPRGDRS